MTDAPTPAGQGATAISRKDLEAKIVAKAWRDPAYQARLLADPKAVLQEELSAIDPSITLPESLRVFVHPEDADTFHLVEPRNPSDVASPAATDDQLAGVAPQTVAVVVGTNSSVVVDGHIVASPINVANVVLVSGVVTAVVTNAIQMSGWNATIVANINLGTSVANANAIA